MPMLRRVLAMSLFVLVIAGPVQALDLSSDPTPSSATSQTLIVVFGAREHVFAPMRVTSTYAPPVVSASAALPVPPAPPAPAVPEPATLALVGVGMLALIAVARRRSNG